MVGLIVAGVVSAVWCLAAIWLGPRIGFLDEPDDSSLKAHVVPAVPLGGVGIFVAVHIGSLVLGEIDLTLLSATATVLVLGLVDDRWGLPPLGRLAVEAAAGLVLILGTPSYASSPLLIVLGLALVLVSVNAVNLFDGIDGLAASTTLVSSLGLAWLAWSRGLQFEPSLLLAAALGGFLVFGWHPAKVFLGDAGAYVIGILLADSMMAVSGGSGVELLAVAGFLGVLALDLVVTLIRRAVGRRPLFKGDRSHIYDRLRDRGMTVRTVVLVSAGLQVILVAVTAYSTSELAPGVALVVVMTTGLLSLVGLARAGFLNPESA